MSDPNIDFANIYIYIYLIFANAVRALVQLFAYHSTMRKPHPSRVPNLTGAHFLGDNSWLLEVTPCYLPLCQVACLCSSHTNCNLQFQRIFHKYVTLSVISKNLCSDRLCIYFLYTNVDSRCISILTTSYKPDCSVRNKACNISGNINPLNTELNPICQ